MSGGRTKASWPSMLFLLVKAPRTVRELQTLSGAANSTVRNTLSILEAENLVVRTRAMGTGKGAARALDLEPDAVILAFTVPGAPVGKGRPRVGKFGNHARLYTPAKTVGYEGLVAHQAFIAMQGAGLIEGACEVILDIVCQVPASWSKRKQAEAVGGRIHPTTKPDIDNVEKVIFDGMNGVVWKDDVQVVRVIKGKRYGDTPCVVVTVTAAELNWHGSQQAALGVAAVAEEAF